MNGIITIDGWMDGWMNGSHINNDLHPLHYVWVTLIYVFGSFVILLFMGVPLADIGSRLLAA
jgi:hypothetical protein